MVDRANCIPLNGAPSQYDRYLRFEEDPARVDDRSEAQLLAFSVEFGRLLNFYNIQDVPDGDWSAFFLNDPTIALASVLALDLQKLQSGFASLEKAIPDRGPDDRKAAALAACYHWLLDLAHQFNGWLAGTERLLNSPSARMFSAEVRHLAARSLGEALRSLRHHSEESPAKEALALSPLSFSEFLPVWELAKELPAQHHRQENQEIEYREAAAALRPLFHAFLAALQRLREYAVRHLADTLAESDHQPTAALYIAFVHLFRIAQRTVNQVTPKFAKFYYTDILRARKTDSRADTVYLTASVNEDFAGHAATIALGTRFASAAAPLQPSRTYAARQDVTVSAATLDLVRTIRVVPGSLCDGAEGARVPIQIIASEIRVDAMNPEAPGYPNTAPAPWPTFGAAAPGASPAAVASLATLGVAIVSPYLMLTGGERTVTVIFTSTPFSGPLNSTLDELAAATGLSQDQVLEAILAGAFDMFLSTSGAWFQVPAYTASYTPASTDTPLPTLSLSCALPADAPPVVAFGTLPSDSANPAPLLPTLQLRLRQTPVAFPAAEGQPPVSTYPLSTLRLVDISSIAISTDTRSLSDLNLQNTNGPVDTSSPFPLLGVPPVAGAYLRVSNPELFVKVPASLELSVEWYALPADITGFQGYYQDYKRDLNGVLRPDLFNNATFRCWIEVRKPGLWQIPAPDSDPDCQLYLFRTMDGQVCAAQPTAGGALCPVSTFPDLAIQPETPSPFYSAAESALELTLTAPSYAFGNLLYAPNVLNAVIDDLPAPPGSTSTTPAPATDTRALRSAVDALSTLSKKASEKSSRWFGRSSPNKYRENLAAAVQEWQANLLAEVRTYLQRNLVPIAGAGAAQVRSLLATAPAGTSADKARSLDAALQAASPALPSATAGVTAIASLCLQAVPAVDQALQQCASQDGGDYQICVESSLAALQTQLDQALDSVADGPVKLQYPNPPWLPQARSVSVGYTASCSFQPSGTAQAAFYYLLPFGAYQLPPDSADAAPFLSLPAYPGELLLGLSSLEVPQTLNILFQMAPGGFRNPPAVIWEHLEETWTRFQDADEPADTTNDLQQTGIVSLIIPAPSTTQQTVAPADRRWLRAVAASDKLVSPDLFPETIGIFLNPVLADRVDGAPDNPSRPTPANTIRKPTQKLHGVGNIQQPSDSFGGRAEESEEQLQTRQAERLRHKDRAVLPWDYERLVLQAFPDIWKVRALPATGDKPNERSLSRRPGHVLVVVVAGPSTAAKDPTRPVATVQTLQQIHQFLKARASVFARIRVVNPYYVGILVTALVSFTPGEDPGGSIDRLDSDLVQYLSPWFYDDLRAEKSGDYASQDAIIEFILSRSYVAALNKITFEYEGDFQEGWCFYTSAPKHRIRQDTSRKKAPL